MASSAAGIRGAKHRRLRLVRRPVFRASLEMGSALLRAPLRLANRPHAHVRLGRLPRSVDRRRGLLPVARKTTSDGGLGAHLTGCRRRRLALLSALLLPATPAARAHGRPRLYTSEREARADAGTAHD